MLNKKTKQLMKAVYYKAVEKDGTCLISQNDLLAAMPYTFQFKKSELAATLKSLVSEGYFELITTEKKGVELFGKVSYAVWGGCQDSFADFSRTARVM